MTEPGPSARTRSIPEMLRDIQAADVEALREQVQTQARELIDLQFQLKEAAALAALKETRGRLSAARRRAARH